KRVRLTLPCYVGDPNDPTRPLRLIEVPETVYETQVGGGLFALVAPDSMVAIDSSDDPAISITGYKPATGNVYSWNSSPPVFMTGGYLDPDSPDYYSSFDTLEWTYNSDTQTWTYQSVHNQAYWLSYKASVASELRAEGHAFAVGFSEGSVA